MKREGGGRIRALAMDLDGTLTSGGQPIKKELNEALRGLRHRGTRLILATGRCVSEAESITGGDLFDAVVAENGAVLLVDGVKTKDAPSDWGQVRARLLPHLESGCEEVILSTDIGNLEVARRLASDRAVIELNKDRLMIVPPGVTKGKGLSAALVALRLEPRETACVGDGENDVSMFGVAGIKVALANSVEGLKLVADMVTSRGDGDGTLEAIGKLFPKNASEPPAEVRS